MAAIRPQFRKGSLWHICIRNIAKLEFRNIRHKIKQYITYILIYHICILYGMSYKQENRKALKANKFILDNCSGVSAGMVKGEMTN